MTRLERLHEFMLSPEASKIIIDEAGARTPAEKSAGLVGVLGIWLCGELDALEARLPPTPARVPDLPVPRPPPLAERVVCKDCEVWHGGCLGCDSTASELAERGHRTRPDGSHWCGGYSQGQRDLGRRPGR